MKTCPTCLHRREEQPARDGGADPGAKGGAVRRCDLCNESSKDLTHISDEFKGEGLEDICGSCCAMISDSLAAAMVRLHRLRDRIRLSIWQRCVAAIRGVKP